MNLLRWHRWKLSPDRWLRVRAGGFFRFVFVWGALVFGLSSAAVVTVSNYRMLRRLVSLRVLSEGDVPALFETAVMFNGVFFLVVGIVLAVIVWAVFEWRYHRGAAPEGPSPIGRNPRLNRVLLVAMIAGILTLITLLLPWIERVRDAAVASIAKRTAAPAERFYDSTHELRDATRTTDLRLLIRARGTAQTILNELPLWKNSWNYGNAVHYSHLVLGRLALHEKNVDAARRQLLAAGATPGSPQLDDYGPDMTLAEEMLRIGESSSVLDYFDLCNKFWLNKEKNRLKGWSAAVREGRIPEFGCLSGISCQRPAPNATVNRSS